MKLSSNKKIILYVTIMTLIVLIVVVSQMILFSYQTSTSRILPGVYANGLYIGGMTKDNAREVIDRDLSAYLLDNNVTIVNGETELIVHASNIANVDIDELTEEAYNANRDESPITYLNFIKMKFKPVNIETTAILDWQNIYDFIELNQHLFYTSPVEAHLTDYSFVDGQLKLSISKSQIGHKINVRETASAVQEALADKITDLTAIMETIEPNISTESLLKMVDTPAQYSQVFPVVENNQFFDFPSDLHRIDNLTEPVLIMPEQSISIKEFMNYENYNPKISSFKQLHIPTIIYGCALQVGLIVEEHHTYNYIIDDMDAYPYGQEAVLAADRDLILKNNFAYPIIMVLAYESQNNSHRLTCKIYHVESLEYTYIKSIIERHDEYYDVKIYRVYANDSGGVLSRTLLEEHTYPVPFEIIRKEDEIIEPID